MHRFRQVLVLAMIAVALAVAGCAQPAEEEPALTPKIEPPAIGEAGVLRAGIDLEYPPFGGTDRRQKAGIDVDVASALASELGLELEIVDLKPSELATALAEGDIDVAMSVPFDEASMGSMSLAGSYYSNGPAFFVTTEDTASVETTGVADQAVSLSKLSGILVGAQEASPAFWTLDYELGEGAVTSYPTLRGALEALEAGEIDVVAGDAFVGAYIARDMDSVLFAGQLVPAIPYGIGVGTAATELEDAVRSALDTLASQGVLDTIRTKWLGSLPTLDVASSE